MRSIYLHTAVALGLTIALGLATPAATQTSAEGTQPGAGAEQQVPAAILAGLLAGTPEGMADLRLYLAADGASPDDITARAVQVVQQLRDRGLTNDASLIVAAADRLAQTVSESLNAARVTQLRVDRAFRPPEGAIAFDFGPPDKPPSEGFQRIQPGDSIIQGEEIRGLRRPGQGETLLSGGIAGIEELNVNLPDGEYRVILMTEALGDAAMTLAPFGKQIVANGQALDILNTPPEDWLDQAVLSQRGLDGMQNAGNRQGGVMTLTVRVTGGRLRMDFRMPGAEDALKTYLTGMVIQPIEQPPLLARTPEADASRLSVDQRMRSEAQVATAIAQVLERIPTAAGPGTGNVSPLDLPPPVVELPTVASPS